jgi:hypothetical protein
MKKILLFVPFLLLMLSLPTLAIAGGGDGDKKPKEELRLDADEAIRYARWKNFLRFRDTWSVKKDTSGTAWVVTAERSKKVKKAFRDHNGSVYKCGAAENCRLNIKRNMVVDEKTARIIRRNQYRSFTKD